MVSSQEKLILGKLRASSTYVNCATQYYVQEIGEKYEKVLEEIFKLKDQR